MTINGVEFEGIDFTNADLLEKIDAGAVEVNKKAERLKNERENLSLAEGIRQECKIVKEFFDSVFGEGTSEEIFKGKDSLVECLNAYEDVMNAYQEQYKVYNDRINQYSPDRLQR